MSDCTLTTSGSLNAIQCQCCCTNPKKQESDSDDNCLAAAWICWIICRAEENTGSKRSNQVCQEMSLPHKQLFEYFNKRTHDKYSLSLVVKSHLLFTSKWNSGILLHAHHIPTSPSASLYLLLDNYSCSHLCLHPGLVYMDQYA